MQFEPYDYQTYAANWIVNKPRCAIWLDMGLGKTASTLLALDILLYDRLEISKILVIAPLLVAKNTWPEEIQKWDTFHHLRYAVVCGTSKQRMQALHKKADMYIINRENIVWLLNTKEFDYDMVVIDELSSFKTASTKRFKALKRVINQAKRVVGLTGTPAPNGLMDLWAQMFLIDRGQRLGRTISTYRNTYFRPGRRNGTIIYDYIPLDNADIQIRDRLLDICLSMRKEDYVTMPDKLYHQFTVTLDVKTTQYYKQMEHEAIVRLQHDEMVFASQASAVSGKLQQIASGQVYTLDEQEMTRRRVVDIHNYKIQALETLIEAANGHPVIVFYKYQHERDKIQAHFCTRQLHNCQDLMEWNHKKIPILLAHPASIGHGLNLQAGGHIIIWYSLPWSLEQYLQANDRLYRQGQKETVQIYHVVVKDTVDEAIMRALETKEDSQNALIQYFKAKIKKEKRD